MTTQAWASDILIWQRLLREMRPHYPHLIGALVFSLLATPLMLLLPLPLRIAVDSVIGTDPLPAFLAVVLPKDSHKADAVLLVLAGLYLLIGFLNQVQQSGTHYLRSLIGEHLTSAFRTKLFHHAQRLSLAYHDTKGTADAIYRVQWDAAYVQYLTLDGAIPLITAVFMLAGMIVVTASIDWGLALIALAVSPLVLLTSQLYRHRLRRQAREVKELESSLLSVTQEVLGALRIVKAFGREAQEDRRFSRRSQEVVRARIRFSRAEGVYALIIGMWLAAGISIVLFLGVRQVQAGTITLGNFLLVMSYLLQLYQPLRSVSEVLGRFESHLASLERAFALFDEVPDVPEQPDARPVKQARGAVEFRDVTFCYPGQRPVLRRASFDIAPGSRVGIVGATGAGKTTLISLLMRFYDPTSGQIMLDGVDVREYRLCDLRDQFSVVLQDPVLFSTTIAENITYARPEATQEEIAEAAQAADIHEFIVNLPDGYDTVVGERGMRLSGGERQRIALARAFLRDTPILILDEPTSAVDSETESAIIDAMGRLMSHRTTFIITHRPSMLKNCDILFRIEQGVLQNALLLGSVDQLEYASPIRAPCEKGGRDD
jgi:ATP-binding cassette, subfamily B, bacterial